MPSLVFSHHHLICLNKWHLHLQDFNFSSFQRKMITVASALNFTVLLKYLSRLKACHRELLQTGQQCVPFCSSGCKCASHTLEVLRTGHTLRILRPNTRESWTMHVLTGCGVCNPRGSRVTHHAHRVECQYKQFWICPQSLTCSWILPPPLDPAGYQQGCPI